MHHCFTATLVTQVLKAMKAREAAASVVLEAVVQI